MDIRKVTDELSVAPQISAADIAAAKAAGFRAIICNRPDGEAPGQPAFADVEAAAKTAGLAISYQPVRNVSLQDAADFAKACSELPKPVLAYCRTGTRCITLWTVNALDSMSPEEVLRITEDAGYDMSKVVASLAN